jgi:hypothetical protein
MDSAAPDADAIIPGKTFRIYNNIQEVLASFPAHPGKALA